MAEGTLPLPPQPQDHRWSPDAIWKRLTEPSGALKNEEQRRRARLLSSMLVVIIPLMLVAAFVAPGFADRAVTNPFDTPIPFVALGATVILGTAYFLSRSRNYEQGGLITVAVISASAFIVMFTSPTSFTVQSMTVYLSASMLLSSVLISIRGTVLVAIANLVAAIAFPFLAKVEFGTIVPSLTFNIVMAAVIIVSASIRQRDLAQIEDQSKQLAEAVNQAKEANKLKDQFLATMSHELRTPLNAIIGFAEVIMMGLAGEISSQGLHSVDRIHHNSERLLDLIDAILDISKIEAGRAELAREPFSPKELLSTIELTLRKQAVDKGLQMDMQIDPTLPSLLVGDIQKVERVLTNLVSNAIKFTESGEVKINVTRPSQTEWGFVVVDTGIGIPVHAQEYVFDKFRQVDGTSRRAYGGSGLGLAITRELVLLMGGNIKLSSEPKVGSTFSVTLPLIETERA